MSATALTPEVQAAITRSAMYETLALAWAYPTPALCERLREGLSDLLEEPTISSSAYAPALADACAALPTVSVEALAVEHNHLFEHSAVCSPYETEYEPDPFAKARQLADIAGFYTAFGMTASSIRPTTQDYLGTELEFMAYLARKEAYAAARNWKHRRRLTLEAERSFLRDHLGRWERAVCRDVTNHTAQEARRNIAASFYGAVASVSMQYVEDELRRFGAKPLRLTQRMTGNDEPVACPFGESDEELFDPTAIV